MNALPLLLAAAAQSASAAQTASEPPIPSFFTGGTLYRHCRNPNDGQCMMYVAGALDGMFYARSRSDGRPLCPARMNNREAAGLVADYLRRHPEAHAIAAASAVRRALADRLRCDDD